MKKQEFNIRVNAFKNVIENILYKNGVSYVPGKDEYTFYVNGDPCRVTIKENIISILKLDSNVSEHFIFPASPKGTVYYHYTFSNIDVKTVHLTHSEVTFKHGKLEINPLASGISIAEGPDHCANKVVFFSNLLLGESFVETIDKVIEFETAIPTSLVCEDAVETTENKLYDDIMIIEENMRKELIAKQTR